MTDPNDLYRDCLATDAPRVAAGRGGNRIPEPERVPLWRRYAEKFRDPLIIILLVALLLSVGVSLYEYYSLHEAHALLEPVGVFCAILLATGVGFAFEVRAEREFEVLNQVGESQPVKVVRRRPGSPRGEMMLIPRCDVVEGDIVRVEAGDLIPADGVLLASTGLTVDESDFTGEPFAAKSATPEATGPARASAGAYPAGFVVGGSTVIEGNAILRVTAVGIDSEEGLGVRLTHEESDVKTPLKAQLDQLGHYISWTSFAIAVLIVVGRMGYLAFGPGDFPDDLIEWAGFLLTSLMLAVTLIVVAVPEGLPMSITVSLALSMRRMLRAGNLVRRLHACETMGAATVICTDKTGTLTQNRMTVVESELYGDDLEAIARSIAVNSTAELTADGQVIGNPTEGALLKWLEAQGFDYRRLRESVSVERQTPFSSGTKQMLTTATHGGQTHRYAKGAPELVLADCTGVAGSGDPEAVASRLRDYQGRAFRTLGLAIDSTFVGIVGIADPVRTDVADAIATCTRGAGVRVIIVTGDTAGTAAEVGRQLGVVEAGGDPLDDGQVMTGTELAQMSDDELTRRLSDRRLRVVARARPEDKARLVTLLQRMGEVVAVTGDGTNDAPALAKAQVGLSMGSGTARAKDASDITIIDDSFTSVVRAILWGRSIYLNIQRFIVYQMTINVCACLIVLYGAFSGLDSPLGVTQMLWVNLIMDTFAAMALSSLPAEPRVLTERPRSARAHIINRTMGRLIVGGGLVFTAGLVALWHWLHQSGSVLTPTEHAIFFTTFVVVQFWNLFNVRYYRTGRSALGDLIAALRRRGRPSGLGSADARVADGGPVERGVGQSVSADGASAHDGARIEPTDAPRGTTDAHSSLAGGPDGGDRAPSPQAGELSAHDRAPSPQSDGPSAYDRARIVTGEEPFFSRGFMLVAVLILAGQILITELVPDLFQIAALPLRWWGVILLATMPVFLVPDVVRFLWHRRRRSA